MYFLIFVVSFFISLFVVLLVRGLERRIGKASKPRQDRWHDKPTPNLGGVGIFIGFLLASFLFKGAGFIPVGFLIGSGLTFVLGLVDDFWNLSPMVKLLGLFPAILVMIFSGVGVSVFSWDWLNAVVSFLWMMGITNAFNLLDNMDGLAGGIGLVILGFLVYFFAKDGNAIYLSFTVSVMGAVLGFWMLNVPPASIFMGDSGSLCLGLTLAALSISRKPYTSHPLMVVGTSLFLFFVPIFDTAMVIFTRQLRGQSPLQGGVDHTSHRLVAMGLSERQTMMVLMLITLLSGLCAAALESWSL